MTTSIKSETAAKRDTTKLQRAIVDGLEDVKAHDIQVFDTEHLSPLFERVVVATGSSNRQTKALAASVRDAVREAGFPKPRTEGEDNGEWIIVDCGQAVVHVMQPAIRQYYRLEEIWGEKPVRVKLGAAKPRKTMASEDAGEAAASGGVAAKKAVRKSATRPAPSPDAQATAPAAEAPAARKGSAAKKTTATEGAAPRKRAASGAAESTARPATKAPGKKPAAKATQTVVVNKPVARKAATGKAPTAKKTPARKAVAGSGKA